MKFQEYLQWFEDNRDLVSILAGDKGWERESAVRFSLDFNGVLWLAGYKYFQDWKGYYFFDNLMGSGNTMIVSLEDCYNKTSVVVEKAKKRLQELETLPHFVVGQKYVLYALGHEGNIEEKHNLIYGEDGKFHGTCIAVITGKTFPCIYYDNGNIFEEVK